MFLYLFEMKETIKCSGYYFLVIQLHVLATVLANFLLEFVLAFFLKDLLWFLIVEIVIGLFTELLLCFLFARRQTGKRTSLQEIFVPFVFALVLHFLLALVNKFYVYTAGVAANTVARFWETVVRAEPVVMVDVAFWRRIVSFLPVQFLLCGAFYLGYRNGKKSEKKF